MWCESAVNVCFRHQIDVGQRAEREAWEGDQCERRRRNIPLSLAVLSLKWEQTLPGLNTGPMRFWLEKITKAVGLEEAK